MVWYPILKHIEGEVYAVDLPPIMFKAENYGIAPAWDVPNGATILKFHPVSLYSMLTPTWGVPKWDPILKFHRVPFCLMSAPV